MGTLENLGIYFTIFFVQIIQLCVSTFRTALMARDEKIVNTLLAFIQSLFYILVAAQVLVNIKEDPMQVVVYVLGALVGTYIGMVIDEKLAIGQDVVTVIVDVEKGNKIVLGEGHFLQFQLNKKYPEITYLIPYTNLKKNLMSNFILENEIPVEISAEIEGESVGKKQITKRNMPFIITPDMISSIIKFTNDSFN